MAKSTPLSVRYFCCVIVGAIGMAAVLDFFGMLTPVGPFVTAPMPGPCGCGGHCCRAAEPPGMYATEQGPAGRWDRAKAIPAPPSEAEGWPGYPLPLAIEVPPPPEIESESPWPEPDLSVYAVRTAKDSAYVQGGDGVYRCRDSWCDGHPIWHDCPKHGLLGPDEPRLCVVDNFRKHLNPAVSYDTPVPSNWPHHWTNSCPRLLPTIVERELERKASPISDPDISSVSTPVVPALQVIESAPLAPIAIEGSTFK